MLTFSKDATDIDKRLPIIICVAKITFLAFTPIGMTVRKAKKLIAKELHEYKSLEDFRLAIQKHGFIYLG